MLKLSLKFKFLNGVAVGYLLLLFVLISCHTYALKIAVVSLAAGEGYEQLVYPGFLNKRDYCQEHGYDFFYFTESLDHSRHHAWSKLKYVEKLLPHYDWVFWADADSLIMNPALCLEDLIDSRYFLIICKQWNGMINSGEFLIQNTPLSFAFLELLYDPALIDKGFYEQGAVNIVLQNHPFSDQVLFLHQRAMNSMVGDWGDGCQIAWYKTGDFILHFMGCRGEVLAKAMRMWYDLACFQEEKIRGIYPEYFGKRCGS